jgi:hypothetical protein
LGAETCTFFFVNHGFFFSTSKKRKQEKRDVAKLLPELKRLKASILESKGTEGPLDQHRMELLWSKKVLTEQNVKLHFIWSWYRCPYILKLKKKTFGLLLELI